jgi:hypothetical protein
LRRNFISLLRPQTTGAPIHYPLKASGALKLGNCFLTAAYPRQFFSYGFDKKDGGLKIYKNICSKVQQDIEVTQVKFSR